MALSEYGFRVLSCSKGASPSTLFSLSMALDCVASSGFHATPGLHAVVAIWYSRLGFKSSYSPALNQFRSPLLGARVIALLVLVDRASCHPPPVHTRPEGSSESSSSSFSSSFSSSNPVKDEELVTAAIQCRKDELGSKKNVVMGAEGEESSMFSE